MSQAPRMEDGGDHSEGRPGLRSEPGTRVEREGGVRRASALDFHSFRVIWVTIALTRGVLLELVQKVTGHKTTDIVLKRYFQPGREAFRQALNAAMPKLLTEGEDQKAEVGQGPGGWERGRGADSRSGQRDVGEGMGEGADHGGAEEGMMPCSFAGDAVCAKHPGAP